MTETINTTWKVVIYEVWGNEDDGFWINSCWCIYHNYPLILDIEVNNPNHPDLMFKSASPSDNQLREALRILPGVELNTDGDDVSIYVSSDDYYPLGELHCTSHVSLSPIRSWK